VGSRGDELVDVVSLSLSYTLHVVNHHFLDFLLLLLSSQITGIASTSPRLEDRWVLLLPFTNECSTFILFTLPPVDLVDQYLPIYTLPLIFKRLTAT
jgi:hypothetical protein